jgi:NAD(P)H-nitrite reductase large subunit
MAKGDRILLTDLQGNPLEEAEVARVIQTKTSDRTQAVQVRVPREIAPRVAGFRIQEAEAGLGTKEALQVRPPDEAIICRCERVTVGRVRELIRRGVRDLNQLKALTRVGMGACGGKTCQPLLVRLCREEGIPPQEVVPNTTRPVFVETPLRVFANLRSKGGRR